LRGGIPAELPQDSRTGGIEADGDEGLSGNRLMRLEFFGLGERISTSDHLNPILISRAMYVAV
jgi:hypothetical protein